MLALHILLWFIFYFLPAGLAFVLIRFFSERGSMFRAFLVHGALVFSIFLTQYLLYSEGKYFPWHIHLYSVMLFALALITTPFIVGRFSIFYIFSAFVQELTMLSMAFYLMPTLSFWLAVIFIVPVYAFSHFTHKERWQARLWATSVWGILSIALFSYQKDILLNTALHAIFGAVLIYYGIIYVKSDFSIARSQKYLNE